MTAPGKGWSVAEASAAKGSKPAPNFDMNRFHIDRNSTIFTDLLGDRVMMSAARRRVRVLLGQLFGRKEEDSSSDVSWRMSGSGAARGAALAAVDHLLMEALGRALGPVGGLQGAALQVAAGHAMNAALRDSFGWAGSVALLPVSCCVSAAVSPSQQEVVLFVPLLSLDLCSVHALRFSLSLFCSFLDVWSLSLVLFFSLDTHTLSLR